MRYVINVPNQDGEIIFQFEKHSEVLPQVGDIVELVPNITTVVFRRTIPWDEDRRSYSLETKNLSKREEDLINIFLEGYNFKKESGYKISNSTFVIRK